MFTVKIARPDGRIVKECTSYRYLAPASNPGGKPPAGKLGLLDATGKVSEWIGVVGRIDVYNHHHVLIETYLPPRAVAAE